MSICDIDLCNTFKEIENMSNDVFDTLIKDADNIRVAEMLIFATNNGRIRILKSMYVSTYTKSSNVKFLPDILLLISDKYLAGILSDILSDPGLDLIKQVLNGLELSSGASRICGVLEILNAEKATAVLKNCNNVLLKKIIELTVTRPSTLSDKRNETILIISSLDSYRVKIVLELLDPGILAGVLILVNEAQVRYLVPFLNKETLSKTLSLLNDKNLTYVLSQIDCKDVVRTLLERT